MRMTVEQAIKEAIQAEKTAENVYLGLEQKFCTDPEIAAYWKQFAIDEANAIFCFLIDNFAVDQHIRDFLLAQLAQHIHRLSTNLPLPCRNIAARQTIMALD